MNNFLNYFLLFYIYSILGFFIETLAVLIEQKKLTNRGFFIGPYCPIYGFVSITIILYLSKYQSNPLIVFLLAFIVCSIFEYLTSYIMEKLFKARWWDYSHLKFNLNGRICLQNCILFGILGLLLIYLINPFILHIIEIIPTNTILILTIILLILFIVDVIISFTLTEKLKTTFDRNYLYTDSTTEIKKIIFKALRIRK